MKSFTFIIVVVLFHLTLGKAAEITDIRIEGRRWTKLWVIERELEISVGDTLCKEALDETRKRLMNLGIFNDVRVASDSTGVVTIDLAEAWNLWPIIDPNMEETQLSELFENPREFFRGLSLDLGITDFNLLGTGASAYAMGRVGVSRGGTATYYTRWFSPGLPLMIYAHFRNLRMVNRHAALQGVDSELDNIRGDLWVGTRVGAPTRVGLTLRYDYLEEEPIWLGAPAPKDKTGQVGFFLIIDRRDLEWYPSKGCFVLLETSYTGGDRHYFRTISDARAFWPLTENTRPLIFAMRLRGGTASGNLPPWGKWYHGFDAGFRGYRMNASESDGFLTGAAELRFPLTKIVHIDLPMGNRFRRLPFGLNGLFFIERTELRLGHRRTEFFAGGVGLACRVPNIQIIEIDLSYTIEGDSEISTTIGMSF